MKKAYRFVLLLPILLLAACVATQGEDGGKPRSLLGSLSATGQGEAKDEASTPPANSRTEERVRNVVEGSMQLQKVGNNIWRARISAGAAFQTLVRILAQGYVLGATDRKQMTVSTEWDKFLIDGKIFRNRVNVSVFSISARSTEIVVHNAVEYYEGDGSVNMKESNWIPTVDVTNEVQRIVSALARQASAHARR